MLKIFYAVQATGNGHISRANQLYPHLKQLGQVDFFLSGNNYAIQPQFPVKYSSEGLSLFYNASGGLSYKKIMTELKLKQVYSQAKQLPIEQYDLVINDFESITALACYLKKKKSIGVGHQAAFQSKQTPRPAKTSKLGEYILKYYGMASSYVGFHFQSYDDFILPAVINESYLKARCHNYGHITVYLPHFSTKNIVAELSKMPEHHFHVFTKTVSQITSEQNITLMPIDAELFYSSLVDCSLIITGAGFETPAEALYLGKKMIAIPIKGQYEQACNAAALQQLGVRVLTDLHQNLAAHITATLNQPDIAPIQVSSNLRQVCQTIVDKGLSSKPSLFEWPDWGEINWLGYESKPTLSVA